MTDPKDLPANRKAFDKNNVSRKQVIETRIMMSVTLVILISFFALIIILSERRSNRIEIQTINEKSLKITPNSSTENEK